jgi:hypothetical protein
MRIHPLQALTIALGSLAGTGTAQEYVLPLGFASNAGPPTDDVPVARLKDNNLDGSITPGIEMASFLNWFGSAANTRVGYPSPLNFMVDGVWVIENGEPAFYFTDTEEGRVIRCVDTNHNGFIDASEFTVFFDFGLSTSTSPTTNSNGLFAPKSVAVWRDTVNNRSIVYAALDNSAPSTLGYTHGIYRLIDVNGNGTAMDAGVDYAAPFVNSTMGLTVPGRSGPVTITHDFWSKIRVAPGGKLLAYASGAAVTAPAYTVQPEMNAWYGFTDNNGVATAEVWFNASSLNNLPMHPDFDDPRVPSTSLYPNWDIQDLGGTNHRHFGGFLGIAPGAGPGGADVYVIGCTYNTAGLGDINLNGQHIAGLFYRVLDFNHDQHIDPGELSLLCNISGNTYNGVAPVSFVNPLNSLTVSALSGRQWGFDVAPDGSSHFSYVLGTTQTGFVAFRDNNLDFVVDNSEINVPAAVNQIGSPYPFDQLLGPYLSSNPVLPDGLMPGPFATAAAPTNGTLGVTPFGDGCVLPSNHLKVVMDTWSGNPQIGNAAFKVGTIRMPPGQPAFLVADFNLAPTPVPLAAIGLAADCFGYLQNPTSIGFSLADAKGRAMLPVPIPGAPALTGLGIWFQSAALDLTNPLQPVPFYTTNALQLVIQP